ncbi:hypothetical protein [Borrelia hermsii]|uniref:Protein BptA n=2 Tax=Borrelia hermsii TaxID=140 RepID=T1ECD4_BORHE|nr:hypothetical protein [Borrelia hermsii]ADN26374.1 hypothetical protein BHA117 [Borrelia hermsii]AMR75957.1 hypothetical protein A0V01_04920 [Borrelia hermsii]ANA43762.1 hypothetical protein AXX13_A0605 [Borrelia hermsii HS1]UPA08555.1 hypothetical protein bhDAH_001266 [Borrelia hermsii DAH]
MFIKATKVICRLCLLCLIGVFLLGVKLESSCRDDSYCNREYSKEFNFGSIRRIVFTEEDLAGSFREKIKRMSDGGYKSAMLKGYPSYYLKFEIVDGPRAVNFKKVIFDGVEAEVSIFHLYEPNSEFAMIKDFQMGRPDENPKFLKVIFPTPVYNTFIITLSRRFVDKLKARDRLKITLTTHYDKEFVLETDNFIRKYEF